MPMDLPNDCELYQELLSTPYHELLLQQQSALEHHLLNCSVCALYKVEGDLLCSLLNMLPVPDMEPGLPPQLEEFLQRSREEAAEQSVARSPWLSEEGTQILTEEQQSIVQYLHVSSYGIYRYALEAYLPHKVTSGIMRCDNCYTSLPSRARFCSTCGQALMAQLDTGILPSDYQKIPTQPLLIRKDDGMKQAPLVNNANTLDLPLQLDEAVIKNPQIFPAQVGKKHELSPVHLNSTEMYGYNLVGHTSYPKKYQVHKSNIASWAIITTMMLIALLSLFSVFPLYAAQNYPPRPIITVIPGSLSFTAEQGGNNPSSQSLVVKNYSGAGIVVTSPSTNDGRSWLSAEYWRVGWRFWSARN